MNEEDTFPTLQLTTTYDTRDKILPQDINSINYGVKLANTLVKAGKRENRHLFSFKGLILTLVYKVLIKTKMFVGFLFTLAVHINIKPLTRL